VKWALHEMGMIPPGMRLPLTPLEAPYHDRVREALKQAGVPARVDV
jgi:4-hydroxy-tetrahydrodipicolinate synthase